MSDLRDLYQEVILDHNRQPRNFGPLETASHKADGYNPLCGDRVTVYLQIQDDRIDDVRFDGAGCAISTASASMLTDVLKGRSLEEARAVFDAFSRLVTADSTELNLSDADRELLGKLLVFQGVCEFPARVKCATLVWHTWSAALSQETDAPVSTEE